jgi:drug/metabolite transporter (DMT)-like permease
MTLLGAVLVLVGVMLVVRSGEPQPRGARRSRRGDGPAGAARTGT